MKYLNYIKNGIKVLSSAIPITNLLKRRGIKMNRISLYCDIVYNKIVRGYDYDDYVTFEFYNKKGKERLSYLSFRENSKLTYKKIPAKIINLFLDKSLFNLRYQEYIKREWKCLSSLSKEDILEFIKRNKSVILKPIDDYGGVGIRKISISDDAIEQKIEKPYADSHMVNGKKEWIIENCIENCEDVKKLAPASLNTLRIVTIIDSKGLVHIPAALLRMGSGTSVMDNYHSGGMACPIDLQTGELTKVATGEYNTKYEVHPFSKIRFKGYKIPEFNKILEIARNVALVEPKARYVGWDFALTPDGIEILEGNIPPGEHITQIASGPIREKLYEWLKN